MDYSTNVMTAHLQDRCATCKKNLPESFIMCQRCSAIRYCSTACLEEDKSKHKQLCDSILEAEGFFKALNSHLNSTIRNLNLNENCNVDINVEISSESVDPSNNDTNTANSTNSGATSSSNTNRKGSSSDAKTTSDTSRGESFGKGWWAGNNKTPKATSNQSAASQTKPSTSGSSSQTSTDETGKSFGKGWWKGKQKTAEATEASTASSASSSKSSMAENGTSFGKGWWKGKSQTTKKNGNLTSRVPKGKKTEASGNSQGTSSENEHSGPARSVDQLFNICITTKRMSHRLAKMCFNLEEEEKTNNCTDIVVKSNGITFHTAVQFEAIKRHVANFKNICKQEEYHGRVIFTALKRVPALYRASLGGSRVSVVLQIIGSYKGFKNTVFVQDNSGVKVPVWFDTHIRLDDLEVLEAGNFVLIRGAFWEVLPDGYDKVGTYEYVPGSRENSVWFSSTQDKKYMKYVKV